MGCASRLGAQEYGEWSYPFPLERNNGCHRVATPFSVENPWDHAHEAVDFACQSGTPVLAVYGGEVMDVSYADVAGERRGRVTLELEGSSLRVEYINLSDVIVSQGEVVDQGDEIGVSATGLHLAVWDEQLVRYIDPADFLILPVPDELLSE
jgi:murein DD-endopeptidase MepM/ murein hydrolase activator NlpD